MSSGVVLLIVVLVLPILWQVPRSFWPLHLNSTATGFTGLYRRYSVASFTGRASDVQAWSDSQTVGSVSAHTTGTIIGGSFVGSTSVVDSRKNFKVNHTRFFLSDRNGATCAIDAANVDPAIGNGHVVSAAWLVHNRKSGTAFVVVDHTTNSVYVEKTRRGLKNAPRGLTKMVLRLPLPYEVLLWLGIVTWPLIILFGVGAQIQLRWFRKHAVKPLVAVLQQRAALA